ncbi:MAG: N-acetyltransferase [Chitinophagaceae bacterium]|nr:MAG: N-acetyltransferase [Chitinophagaceae bacterium]
MPGYNDAAITAASEADIPALIALLNSAYRGDAARQGWTHEADLIAGEQRTDADELSEKLAKGTMLVYKQRGGDIDACVYLEPKADELYLGMLSVRPSLQGSGLGKILLKVAEEHARNSACLAIVMTVISVRTELLEWYQRLGYQETGDEEPFPDDPRFGEPTQPLTFKWLRKVLK